MENLPASIYTLYYRERDQPICTKNFVFHGSLRGATDRGRAHCDLMGYVFNFVKPFITDLDRQEKRKVATPFNLEVEEERTAPGLPQTG